MMATSKMKLTGIKKNGKNTEYKTLDELKNDFILYAKEIYISVFFLSTLFYKKKM